MSNTFFMTGLAENLVQLLYLSVDRNLDGKKTVTKKSQERKNMNNKLTVRMLNCGGWCMTLCYSKLIDIKWSYSTASFPTSPTSVSCQPKYHTSTG